MRSDGVEEFRVAEKRKPKPDDLGQSARFVETAKKLTVDESGKYFELALKKIAKAKPKQQKRQKA